MLFCPNPPDQPDLPDLPDLPDQPDPPDLSVSCHFIDGVEKRLATIEASEIVGKESDELRPVVANGAANVRRHDDIRQVPVRARSGERLLGEHVERRTAKASLAQPFNHRRIVYQ